MSPLKRPWMPDTGANSSRSTMDSSKKSTQPSFSATGEVVKIFLADGTRFLLHREFACHYSAVLREAFNSVLPAGRSHVYMLESTDVETFALFTEWIYTQRLELDEDGIKVTHKVLVQLWVLAQELAVPSLQNRVIDLLHEIYKRDAVISTVCLWYVYDNTTAGSALRRFFIHQCAYGLEPQRLQQDPQHFPQEMLLELALVTRSLLKTRCRVPDEDASKFHIDESND